MSSLKVRLTTVRRQRADAGSITPLAVGFVTIALLLIFIIAVITEIYLAHRKLYAMADSAVLAAATQSFEPALTQQPQVDFTSSGVQSSAQRYLQRVGMSERWQQITVRGAVADDTNIEVRISARYRPSLLSPFVPRGIPLTASSQARGVLRP